jgi:hypothetical protein
MQPEEPDKRLSIILVSESYPLIIKLRGSDASIQCSSQFEKMKKVDFNYASDGMMMKAYIAKTTLPLGCTSFW